VQGSDVHFQVDTVGDVLVAVVSATKIGHENLDRFGEQLKEIVSSNQGVSIVLDMSSVMFIASIAIGRIFSARKQILDSGGAFTIVAKSPAVLHVFDDCRLAHITKIFHTLDEALDEH